MKEEELVKGLTFLGTAYNKEYSKMEAEVHYEFLKEFSYEVFVNAIKEIIKSSKFIPKINEIVEECKEQQLKIKNEVVSYMNSMGYFKDIREYEKTLFFINNNNVPEWLQKDINKYYKIKKAEQIENKKLKMIA